MSRFIMEHVEPGARIYTDDALTYHCLPNHETAKHSVGEYVRGQAHTNGVEPFWSMLKRSYTGTFHKLSPKHLNRYVQEFAWKHNVRGVGTLEQMTALVAGLVGRRLMDRGPDQAERAVVGSEIMSGDSHFRGATPRIPGSGSAQTPSP